MKIRRGAMAVCGLVALLGVAGLPATGHAAAEEAQRRYIPLANDWVGHPDEHASAEIAGDGFNTWTGPSGQPQRARDAYTIRLVESSVGDVEPYRLYVKRAADQIAKMTGVKFTIAPGRVAERSPDRKAVAGEILVAYDTSSPCGTATSTAWAGCAEHQVLTVDNTAGVQWIEGGRMWFNKPGRGTTLYALHALVAHELGHIVGLAHYDAMYQGKQQVMFSGLVGGNTDPTYGDFKAGDINGLRYQHPQGRAPVSLGCCIVGDPDLVSWGAGRLDAFVRGTDNQLYTKSYSNGAWSQYGGLGGALTSEPTAVSVGSGRLDVFARGPQNQLMHRGYNNGWTQWSDLGGSLSSAPDAVATGQRIDVVARGVDGRLVMRTFTGSAWTAWTRFSSLPTIVGGPTIASVMGTRLEVFARNASNNLIRRTRSISTGAWTPSNNTWQMVGGTITSDPEATAMRGVNRVDVFARSGDNALWQTTSQNNGAFSGFQSLLRTAAGGAGATSWGANRIDIVYKSPTSAEMLWKTWDGTTW